MAIIRQAYRDDLDSIREIHEEAFNQPNEADLVETLRKNGKIVISLVAEENRTVVGHILFSEASIEGYPIKILGLAPMAVLPESQNRGIGTSLMRDGLDECLSLGYDAVMVLGHTDFYSRFGFKPAKEYNLQPQWPDLPTDAFMILELHAEALRDVKGIARYAPEFDDQI